MNAKRVLGSTVLPILLACGCENLNHTENGALVGGAAGAGAGAVIGHALGNTGAGALVGLAAGAVTGAAVGDHMDKTEKREAAQARAMELSDVVQMTHNHVNDAIIIQQIRSGPTVFHLSGAEITWLKQNGVSDAVIWELQNTANRYPRRVYTAVPVYSDPVYVYDPPPPPVRVGVGFAFRR
ncbi:MAG: hypothetical protein JO112_05015 [Planctomycetes bacterium]|nr:hypothetical protein [Planctomycetota bacterium]